VLSKQAAELGSQISSLEAQLQGLRLQAAEVDRRRAQLKKQVTLALGNGASGLHLQVCGRPTSAVCRQLWAECKSVLLANELLIALPVCD
jgi:hypothetical protein